MRDGTGRGLGDHRGNARGMTLLQDQAVGAAALGGTNDRTEVVWILDPVGDHEEGRLTALLGSSKNIINC